MKKLYQFLLVLTLPVSLVLFSYVTGSPGGKTGSPGDGGSTCTDCHAGTAQSQSSWITSTIPFSGYTPGETYQVTATGVHPGVVKFGFELTSENVSGAKIGTFVITDVTRTQLANGGKSVTHKLAGTAPTGNSNSWTVDWTAPASGTVRFYAAFNAANGNGNNNGDIIYTSSLTVNELILNPAITGVDPDHAPLDFSGDLSISGQDTEWQNGVSNVRFVYHNDPGVFFEATGITVQSNTELTVSVTIANDLTVGSYDVWVDDLVLGNGFIVDQLDGVETFDLAKSLELYPNPAADFLTVEVPQGADIRMVDLQGRLMMKFLADQQSNQLDVSGFSPGYYLITVQMDGKQTSRKWLKK